MKNNFRQFLQQDDVHELLKYANSSQKGWLRTDKLVRWILKIWVVKFYLFPWMTSREGMNIYLITFR